MKKTIFLLVIMSLFLAPCSFRRPQTKFASAATMIRQTMIAADDFWAIGGSPYLITENLFVSANATLTIEPGVIIKLGQASIYVNGELDALGEENDPVIFTSINDDQRGGKSDPLSTGLPQPGDWGTIESRDDGRLNINQAIINYGGLKYVAPVGQAGFIKFNTANAQAMHIETGAVSLSGWEAQISDSQIAHNIIGIKSQTAGQVSIHNCQIFDNTQGGIFNYGPAAIDAANNWWGDDSGPYHPALNPEGLGNSVSDEVFFDPWIGKPAKRPVIIVPGITGSYLNKNDQDKDEVWPNIAKMFTSLDDSYLDELILLPSGEPTDYDAINAADIIRKVELAGLIKVADIFDGLIKELEANGYVENQDLFVFPYDWRLDINDVAGDEAGEQIKTLRAKIEEVKQTAGAEKVDIIAHSLGGLVAKAYMQKFGTASVDKFIDIATPHLGAPKALKILMYGDSLGYDFLDFDFLNNQKIKNISQNMPAVYQLLPSQHYILDGDTDYDSFIYDMHDYDNNSVKGALDFNQSSDFLINTGRNEFLINTAQYLHQNIDGYIPEGVKNYNIIGCGQPTLGKFYILNKEKSGGWEYGIRYIDGDGTVPLRSAENLETADTYYTTAAEHANLPSTADVKDLVSLILKNKAQDLDFDAHAGTRQDKSLCSFTGWQVSFHSPIKLHIYDEEGNHMGPDASGNIEMGIDGAAYDIIDNNKFAFLPYDEGYIVTGEAEEAGSFSARISGVAEGEYMQTALFSDIPIASASMRIMIEVNSGEYVMQIDQEGDGQFEAEKEPDAYLTGEELNDLIKPISQARLSGALNSSGEYISDVTAEFSAEDQGGAGLLKIEYSLDNGLNWQFYSEPLIIGEEGEHAVLFQAVDRAGNKEETKSVDFKINKEELKINILFPYESQKFLRSESFLILLDPDTKNLVLHGLQVSAFIDTAENNINEPVDLFKLSLGKHAVKVMALNHSGEQASSTVSFYIYADLSSTMADIRRAGKEGMIYNETVSKFLLWQTGVLKKYIERYGAKQEIYDEKMEEIIIKCQENRSAQWCDTNFRKFLVLAAYTIKGIYKKIVILELESLLKQLNYYFSKKWLSQRGYDIIKEDLIYLINNF